MSEHEPLSAAQETDLAEWGRELLADRVPEAYWSEQPSPDPKEGSDVETVVHWDDDGDTPPEDS